MSKDYTLVINGRPEGPFSIDGLKQKGLKPNDFVRTDGMDDYKEAHEMAELRALFGFRKQVVAPQYFGSFDQRVVASVIDWFIVSAGFVVLALIAVVFTTDRMARILIAFSLLLLIPVAKIIYHMVMECSPKQGTYGKQLLKIRVCDMDGNRIGPAKAITRNLAKILTLFTIGIGYLMAFFNKKQQCLHDMVAGTLVTKDRLN
jgi:uncharacterized RDD family membrane protein YckC